MQFPGRGALNRIGRRRRRTPSGSATSPLGPAGPGRGVAEPAITRLVLRAREAGVLRPDFEPADVAILLLMICSVAHYTRGTDREVWRRYLELLIDSLRPDPGRARLSVSVVTPDQVAAVMSARAATLMTP